MHITVINTFNEKILNDEYRVICDNLYLFIKLYNSITEEPRLIGPIGTEDFSLLSQGNL